MSISAESAMAIPSVTITGLWAGYGGKDVIQDVTMSIDTGSIVAVLGPNGSGKSTLLGAVAGLVEASRGSIQFEGTEIRGKPPYRLVSSGLVYVPTGRRLFPYSTVLENLRIGGYINKDRTLLEESIARFVDSWPVLRDLLYRPAGSLSGGEQQVVAIGRGLMSNPRLLLIDEPSIGLAPILVEAVLDLLAEYARNRDLTVLLAEQNVRGALRVAQRVSVLAAGRVVHEGATAGVSPEEIADHYLSTQSHRTA